MESSGKEQEQEEENLSPEFEIIKDQLERDSEIIQSTLSDHNEYGNDLWDSLHILQQQTAFKNTQLIALKTFFKEYRKSIDTFNDSMRDNIKQLRFDMDTPLLNQGIPQKDNSEKNIDTLKKTMLRTKSCIDDLTKHIENKSSLIQQDLIDGLDLYQKDYAKTNEGMLNKALQVWDKMYTQRTNMLWSKEEYLNSMYTFSEITKKLKEVEDAKMAEEDALMNKRRMSGILGDAEFEDEQAEKALEIQDQIIASLEEGCTKAKQNSKAAENNYKRNLDTMNDTIEFFHQNMKPILNKIQLSDRDQTDFLKFNLHRFSLMIVETGAEINSRIRKQDVGSL